MRGVRKTESERDKNDSELFLHSVALSPVKLARVGTRTLLTEWHKARSVPIRSMNVWTQACSDIGQERIMNDFRDKAKDKIDDAAKAAKSATDKIADKSKEATHTAGKKLEEKGKKLQNA
jgi:hypothetical protein